MINQEKIQEWIRTFLNHIHDETLEVHVKVQEGYKFASVDNFQKHFNLEDADFAGMLERSILNNNLAVGARFWPRKMLLIYAQEYSEETRNALRVLFDETKDVYSRINDVDGMLSKINDARNQKLGETANSFIGVRFLSLLLGYRYPEKYNPLKPSEWKFFAKFIDTDFAMPMHTTFGDQYKIYEPYIESLRIAIKDREDIKEVREALTRGLSFADNESRWIAQDIIYVTARVLSGTRKDDDEVSKTELISIGQEELLDESSINDLVEENTGFVPLEKHLEEYVMKNWDLVDFGEKLTLYREDDGTPGQQYVTDVGIIDILAKDAQGNFVVIELKRAESKYHVVGQILNYMQWVQENLATEKEKVRGMIVVGKADATLKSALKQVADKVILKEYRVKMTFIDPK